MLNREGPFLGILVEHDVLSSLIASRLKLLRVTYIKLGCLVNKVLLGGLWSLEVLLIELYVKECDNSRSV